LPLALPFRPGRNKSCWFKLSLPTTFQKRRKKNRDKIGQRTENTPYTALSNNGGSTNSIKNGGDYATHRCI